MIDFVSAEFACQLPAPINSGSLLSRSTDGEIEWETVKRLTVRGSWDTSVQIRAVSPTILEVSGNLAKFMQGHNIFGTDNMEELLKSFFARIQPILWPEGMPFIDIMGGTLSRVDCTSNFELDTMSDVLSWIRAAEMSGNCSHRGRGVLKGEGTLVYGDATGKRAKDWQLTFYSKGLETAKHPLPEPMRQRNDIVTWVQKLLRCEVRLRGAELKRLGLRTVENWQPESCSKVWRDKLSRIDFSEGQIMDCSDFEGVKPRLLDAFDAWKAGRDLRQGRPSASFYRLRREMKDVFGVDIVTKPNVSNVVALRRIVVASPAQRPPWALDLQALLAA